MILYEIDAAIAACIDEETGEVLDVEKLVELNLAREGVLENVALWYKNDCAEAAAIREEEKALAARRQRLERSAESKKAFLENALGGEKFSTPRCAVSFRKTTRVDVDDMGAVVNWLRYKAEKRQAYKPTGQKMLISEIRNNAEKYGEDAVIELINTCMSANWQGIIFERLKNSAPKKGDRNSWMDEYTR